jgi:hypothetical protein
MYMLCRLVLGSFIVYEVLHRMGIKEIAPAVLHGITARYDNLLTSNIVESVPDKCEQDIKRIILNWIPKPETHAPAVWGMSVADKETGRRLYLYVKEVSSLLKLLPKKRLTVWLENYIENVAWQVGGVRRASWLVDILCRKNKRDLLRRQYANSNARNNNDNNKEIISSPSEDSKIE